MISRWHPFAVDAVAGVAVVAIVGVAVAGVGDVHCLSRVDVPKSHAGLCALYGLGSLVECAAVVAVGVDNVVAVAVDLLCVEYVVEVLLVVFRLKVEIVEVWRRDSLVGLPVGPRRTGVSPYRAVDGSPYPKAVGVTAEPPRDASDLRLDEKGVEWQWDCLRLRPQGHRSQW